MDPLPTSSKLRQCRVQSWSETPALSSTHLCYSHVGVGSHTVPAAVAESCHVRGVLAWWDGGNALKGVIHGGELLEHLSLPISRPPSATAGRHHLGKTGGVLLAW